VFRIYLPGPLLWIFPISQHTLEVKEVIYMFMAKEWRGEYVAEKKKTDIKFPFFRIKEDEEGSYVRVGPIEVTDTKTTEEVNVGPLHIREGSVTFKKNGGGTLEGIAWAVFFILIGSVFLYGNISHQEPVGMIPIGVGIIWLSLNYARSRLNLKVSNFTLALGIIAIIWGLTERFAPDVSFMAIAAIALGIVLIIHFGRKAH
jgi:hypothetical protein